MPLALQKSARVLLFSTDLLRVTLKPDEVCRRTNVPLYTYVQKTALTLTALYQTLLSLVRKVAVGYKQRRWVTTEILGMYSGCAGVSLKPISWSKYIVKMFDRQRAVNRRTTEISTFLFSSAHTSLSSLFYRKNNVRQGACEKQMLSAGCGVATIDIYMNYYKKPKISQRKVTMTGPYRTTPTDRKNKHWKHTVLKSTLFQRKMQLIEKGNTDF